MLPVVVWCLFALIALANWAAVVRGDRRTEAVVKPAALLALTTAALAGGAADAHAGWWLVVALLLGTLGDALLLGDSDERFLAGLAAFLVGHAAYLVCFAMLGLHASGWLGAGVLAAAAALVASRTVLPRVLREQGAVVALPVAAYSLVICAMLVAAWSTEHLLVGLGAAVFVASDTVLALDRFDRPARWVAPYPHLVVMVTYHLGQALVVLGVLHALG
ncbi:lysoplasmalogenase [Nocardioides zeae]|uniref:Lysoplasmalogenase n=1 Tax=Nocardioides imazamoxiresistens TaxID=3231893 RepID=A0ABU3PTT3_9ACTN|nr:lysoplasmalogenase [Nocardioides zeae]MDT9592594.1 lysoplasmalogenase [Nocardioides zeae]